MDIFLSKVTQQAMNYAIRTGITITSGYAIRQCSRLLKTVDGSVREELAALQLRLESKIRIVSPAIDMIELIAARGNTSLESAVTLTKSLRLEIQSLGSRLANAAAEEELAHRGSLKARPKAQNELELKLIILDIKKLLNRIEDAVPLINLAITTSGVNLSTSLPATVSPSRLLQASTFLTAGDTQYCIAPARAVQIGPVFTLSMYMLFSGHADMPQNRKRIRENTWKEVIHKARTKLLRVPLDSVYDLPYPDGGPLYSATQHKHGNSAARIPSEGKANEFAYQLLIVEDLDDDRVHTFEEEDGQPEPYDDVRLAGIRELIPIHEISKIFYADTGKILSINADGETNNPILLLKRDPHAVPPRRMMDEDAGEPDWYDESPPSPPAPEDEFEKDEQSELDAQLFRESSVVAEESSHVPSGHHPWRLPPGLDLEWLALEVYSEDTDSDSEQDDTEIESSTLNSPSSNSQNQSSRSSLDPSVASGISKLDLRSTAATPPPQNSQLIPSPSKPNLPAPQRNGGQTSIPAIRTSLSLLEMLIRLTALQQFQQSSHLAIPDEFLTFFLSDSSTVGAGGNSELRRRIRHEAASRVGFDPYDESPIKQRGEEYLAHYNEHPYQDDEAHEYGSQYGGTEEYQNQHSDINSSPTSYRRPPTRPYSPSPHPREYLQPELRTSTRSRQSSPLPGPGSSVPMSPGSEADVPLPSRENPADYTRASPSPLLRRATASHQSQPQGGKYGDQGRSGRNQSVRRDLFQQHQPRFQLPQNRPPTAPPTSSSPRMQGTGNEWAGQGGASGYGKKENLDTPPTSA